MISLSIAAILLIIISIILTWMGISGTILLSIVALTWAWKTNFEIIPIGTMVTIFAIAIFLEILEFSLSGILARYQGGSKRTALLGMLGGFVGAVIGVGFLFVIGGFIGLLIGSFLAALFSEIYAGRPLERSMRIALSTIMGNLAAKIIKTIAIIVMGIYLLSLVLK